MARARPIRANTARLREECGMGFCYSPLALSAPRTHPACNCSENKRGALANFECLLFVILFEPFLSRSARHRCMFERETHTHSSNTKRTTRHELFTRRPSRYFIIHPDRQSQTVCSVGMSAQSVHTKNLFAQIFLQ